MFPCADFAFSCMAAFLVMRDSFKIGYRQVFDIFDGDKQKLLADKDAVDFYKHESGALAGTCPPARKWNSMGACSSKTGMLLFIVNLLSYIVYVM